MVAAFDKMAQMRGFVDDNFSGRDWNLASAMVINGEAAFQIMGDWAKGEFLAAKQVPGQQFGHGLALIAELIAVQFVPMTQIGQRHNSSPVTSPR